MYNMTCKNHRGARYLTKNPRTRGIHFVSADVAFFKACPEHGEYAKRLEEAGESEDMLARMGAYVMCECPCPFADLIFINEDGNEIERPTDMESKYPSWG